MLSSRNSGFFCPGYQSICHILVWVCIQLCFPMGEEQVFVCCTFKFTLKWPSIIFFIIWSSKKPPTNSILTTYSPAYWFSVHYVFWAYFAAVAFIGICLLIKLINYSNLTWKESLDCLVCLHWLPVCHTFLSTVFLNSSVFCSSFWLFFCFYSLQ